MDEICEIRRRWWWGRGVDGVLGGGEGIERRSVSVDAVDARGFLVSFSTELLGVGGGE